MSGDAGQLIEHLPSMHEVLGSIPQHMVVHTCHPSTGTWRQEVRKSFKATFT